MKSTTILPLLTFFSTAIAGDRAQFSAICPSQDGQTKTLQNDYELSYVCKSTGKGQHLLQATTTSNPDDCALACNSTPGCKASAWTWSNDQCKLYSDGEVNDVPLRTSIFMRRESPEQVVDPPAGQDGQSGSYTELQGALDDCEASEQALTEQLAASNTQRDECEASEQDLADQLQASQAQVAAGAGASALNGTVGPAIPQCPQIHGKTKKYGNRNFVTWCNSGMGGTNQLRIRTTNDTFDDCLAACSTEPRCSYVYYSLNSLNPCTLNSGGNGQMGNPHIYQSMFVTAAVR